MKIQELDIEDVRNVLVYLTYNRMAAPHEMYGAVTCKEASESFFNILGTPEEQREIIRKKLLGE